MNSNPQTRGWRFALAGAAFGILAASAGTASAARATIVPDPVAAPASLAAAVSAMPGERLDRPAAQPRTILVAQSAQDIASVNLRLGQLEEQIRTMTGQIEGLQFQMTQMQTLIERMQKDYDFRLQQLEGTSSGKTEAAPQAGGAMPSGETPQNQPDLPAPNGGDNAAGTQDSLEPGAADLGMPDNPDPNAVEIGVPDNPDVDQGGMTLGTDGNVPERGSPPHDLGTLPADALGLPNNQPLDLNLDLNGDKANAAPDTGAIVSDGDAEAQYKAGYDAAARGDYQFAEDQFRQFIALFPDNPHAPDATNWLGEALLQRGEFEAAADVLLTGFQNYPDSERAPNMLLNLGVALNGAGEHDTACRTFDEVRKRYPQMTEAFRGKLNDETVSAGC